MKWFFDMENPVMRALSTVADLMLLNFLTLLCCLPVLTAGAAFTALNAAAHRVIRGEEGVLLKDYFRCFRAELKKGSLLGLLFLLAAALLAADFAAAKIFVPVLCPVIAAMGLLVLILAIYSFALLARYENTLAGTLKNALALAIQFFRYGAPVLLLFGFSLPCYVSLLLMEPVFYKLENK